MLFIDRAAKPSSGGIGGIPLQGQILHANPREKCLRIPLGALEICPMGMTSSIRICSIRGASDTMVSSKLYD
jgi:hypothetical protein